MARFLLESNRTVSRVGVSVGSLRATGWNDDRPQYRSTLDARPLKPYSFNGLGEACTLGHGYAIAHLKGIPACGWFGWFGWRVVVLSMFVPSWKGRIRLMFDWWLTMLLSRDIVNPRT
jgi:NADH dehydrogenase FAD-containing subunit